MRVIRVHFLTDIFQPRKNFYDFYILCIITLQYMAYTSIFLVTRYIDNSALASTLPGMPGTHPLQYFGWGTSMGISPPILCTFGYSRPILVILAQ